MIPVEQLREHKAEEFKSSANKEEKKLIEFIDKTIWVAPSNTTSVVIATPSPSQPIMENVKVYYELLGLIVGIDKEYLITTISWKPKG